MIKMTSDGPKSPGTMTTLVDGKSHDWSNPNNAKISDNSHATSSINFLTESYFLKATNFGFSIPAGATIDGVVVEFEKNSDSSNMRDAWVQLIVGGSRVGDNKGTVTPWPGTDTYISYGGSSDTWNASLNQANVTASDFGVVITAINWEEFTTRNANIDHIRITVYYTPHPILDTTSKYW